MRQLGHEKFQDISIDQALVTKLELQSESSLYTITFSVGQVQMSMVEDLKACDWSVFTNPVFLLVDRSNEFIYADRKIPSCS